MVKSVHHFRLQTERDALRRFQAKTPHIRPLIEEIENSSNSFTPPTIILRYLDDDILNASSFQRLTRPEVKFVARGVLEALAVLHADGFVHTGMYVLHLLDNHFYY